MSSKLQRAQQSWESGAGLLRCPVCGSCLKLEGASVRCGRGHSYDIARKGYVNLARAAGGGQYGKELFESRRTVFAAGCFERVADEIENIVEEHAPEGGNVLDAGCGEGYYAARLAGQVQGRFFGVDLNKDAVAMATDYAEPVCWCVADLARLPMNTGAMDVVLNILSPANYSEFFRVLKKDGIVVKVAPGEGYLQELRGLTGAAPYCGAETKGHIRAMAGVESETRLQYTCRLNEALAGHFFRMTPLTARKNTLPVEELHEMTIDLVIYVLTAGKGRRPQEG